MSFSENQPQLDLQIPAQPEAEKFLVRKRDGRLAPFNEARIGLALESAFRDVLGLDPHGALPEEVGRSVHFLTAGVVERALKLAAEGRELEVELIQDLVENELMRAGQHAVARSYILYREERKKARLLRGLEQAASGATTATQRAVAPTAGPRLNVTRPDGTTETAGSADDPPHAHPRLCRL